MTNALAPTAGRFDIGIIGGGPAGLSAAIWSARYGRSVVVVDGGDPRNWETRGVNGFLGSAGVRPAELRGAGRDELKSLGVTLVDASVAQVERCQAGGEPPSSENEFALTVEGQATLHVRLVLLAIGMRDVWPDIPGLEHVYGANAHVCPDCDGYEARGKRVVVIGHGRRAVAMALALTTWTSLITIVTNGHAPEIDQDEERQKLEQCRIAVRTETVSRLGNVGREITALHFTTGDSLDIDKVFFTIAQYAADDLGVQLGCARDHGGHILVSEHFATSVPGVFAAGDITPGPQLAIRAAAAGAVAAMSMHRSLVPEHRRLREA